LFDHTKKQMMHAKNAGFISYLRILGFVSDASCLLKEMKQTCKVPVINKVADAKKLLSPESLSLFHRDLCISTLYKQAFFNKYNTALSSEYEQSVIIKKE